MNEVIKETPLENPKEQEPKETSPENPENPEVTPEKKEEPKDDVNYAEELNKLVTNEVPAKHKPERSEEEKARFTMDKIIERFPQFKEDAKGEQVADDRIDEMQSLMLRNQVEGIVRQNSKSEDEVKYKMYFYDNRIRQTGNIHDDADNAEWLANKGRTRNALSEMKRDPGSPGAASGPGQKADASAAPELPAEEHKKLVAAGYKKTEPGKYESSLFTLTWDKAQKAWDQVRK